MVSGCDQNLVKLWRSTTVSENVGLAGEEVLTASSPNWRKIYALFARLSRMKDFAGSVVDRTLPYTGKLPCLNSERLHVPNWRAILV